MRIYHLNYQISSIKEKTLGKYVCTLYKLMREAKQNSR
jgi:hypothetical protein